MSLHNVRLLFVFTITLDYLNPDHSPSIVKEIPRPTEKRLSILLSSKDILQESAIYYEKCVKKQRI